MKEIYKRMGEPLRKREKEKGNHDHKKERIDRAFSFLFLNRGSPSHSFILEISFIIFLHYLSFS